MKVQSFTRNRLKYSVNEKFFNKWSSQMAYILGFTYSDGNIYKSTLAWDIQKRDRELLVKIRRAMNSNHPIKERSHSVRLRISNLKLISGAIKRGLMEKKSKRMILPSIPTKFISHFMRGFLDGDGWVVLRNGRNEADIGFVSGNQKFLENVSLRIFEETGIKGHVRAKFKITPNGFRSTTYLMEYFSNNAVRVGNWIYSHLSQKDLKLRRKYMKYLKAVKLYDYINSGSRGVRVVQKKMKDTMRNILHKFYVENHLNAVQIANILKVHSSSIYRWLEKTGTRHPIHRKEFISG
ncbi:MAG: LAGLIDADG family homing endonuclease [Patescibacteria group bacterium]